MGGRAETAPSARAAPATTSRAATRSPQGPRGLGGRVLACSADGGCARRRSGGARGADTGREDADAGGRAGGRLPPGPSAPGRATAAGRRVLRRRSWPPGPSSPPGRCPVSVWAGGTLGTLSAARPRPARGSAPRVRLPETRLWLGGRRSAPLLARLRPGRARRLPPLLAVLSATTCPQTLSPSVETRGPPRAETQASGLHGPRPPCPALAASSAVWGARAGPVTAHTSLSRRPGQARCPDLVARRSPDPPLNL